MPTASGDANAVAVPGEGGSLVVAPYELDEQGEWTFVQVTVDAPIVQFEYYDPNLDINSDQRTFQYLWEGLYPVNSFAIQVQQPFGASGMQFTPGLESPVLGPDSLQYHNGQFGSVDAGQQLRLDMSYTKTGSLLTAEALNPGNTDPGVAVVSSSVDWVQWAGWGLGILGIAILGYAGYRWFRPQPRKDRYRQGRQRTGQKEQKRGQSVFCHNCGTQATAADKFCRECGTELRR